MTDRNVLDAPADDSDATDPMTKGSSFGLSGSGGPLPRGRHRLSREQVQHEQRMRLIAAVAESVREDGYAGTSVASIIKSAGVSRETFYQLYESKLDCYLDAFDFIAAMLLDHVRNVSQTTESPMQRIETAVATYLQALATAPGFARLFLIESFAAGPEAMERRSAIQSSFADAMAEALEIGATDGQGLFACRMFIAAASALVTGPVMDDDPTSILALAEPLAAELRLRFPSGNG